MLSRASPVRFSDRAKIDQIVARTRSSEYGIRSLVNELIQSDLFLNK